MIKNRNIKRAQTNLRNNGLLGLMFKFGIFLNLIDILLISRVALGAPFCTETPPFPKIVGTSSIYDHKLRSLDHHDGSPSIVVGGSRSLSSSSGETSIIMYYSGE